MLPFQEGSSTEDLWPGFMAGSIEVRQEPCVGLAGGWSLIEMDFVLGEKGDKMARYGKAAGKSVRSAMRRRKRGTLKLGRGGKGRTVKSRKQAIAIGLSEARKKGAKVPRKKSS